MDNERPQRKGLRLKNYDYSSNGAYFVTICTDGKEKNLCRLLPPETDGAAPRQILSPIGKAVEEMIGRIPGIDKYVIMPNHIHMIIMSDGAGLPLSRKIRFFKSNLTRKLGHPIWQREYYDHVIRDEYDYRVKWKYIDDNPARWTDDDYYL